MKHFGERESHPLEPEHLEWEYSEMSFAELAESRLWTIGTCWPPSPENRPRVLLQQIENVRQRTQDLDPLWQDDAEILEDQQTAELWCYPEDLDSIIRQLSVVRRALWEAAVDDRTEGKTAYWGSFGKPDPKSGDRSA